ncbi:DNA-formamidopyrimidine glycosylase [Oceanidesulfovibrio indonesiensis]|uniref:Formamidopyrimidine-DNA glycosylase n=1 Tax=Oceanidesulfovibrio indonesiensis TaxID=54767 RepID=A0A7M3MI22_9BACT|nr:bifunctional DNA-formamidopyrimidine glycosylase/DNA-(apurinic or apyrimidinic site) lyase [Oceanidesulfovibrio indonesiensis]TVM18900.1 DNA-formamidopyrimidine glycosylase [Oceanidesulfovibrio indonesiensis]
MPELPEVETIARTLAGDLEGATFEDVDIRHECALEQPAEEFAERLRGRKVLKVGRRGKLLMLLLDSGYLFVCHLRMTGRLYVPQPGDAPEQHTHLVFRMRGAGGETFPLHFRDVRKFGACRVQTPAELARWPFYAGLGPEPLEMSAEDLAGRLRDKRGRIKAVLLDQGVIAGLGNIYVDEALFRADIRPDVQASALGKKRLARLHETIQEVLREAIAGCGSSIRDYVDGRGNAGSFQNCFRVYGRGGQPCLTCGAPLVKTTVAGRTTVYCRHCQKK